MTDSTSNPIIFVVDDDVAFAQSVSWLLSSVELEARLYSSARAFLEEDVTCEIGCVVTDIRMPGMSGLELQEVMTKRGLNLPLIIMTAHGDVDTAVHAMKSGAYDFIQKPFNDQTFIDLVQRAANESRVRAERSSRARHCRALIDTLTSREKEILAGIVDGMTNKAIAEAAGISNKTVEAHRASVMSKTGSNSFADLIKTVLTAKET